MPVLACTASTASTSTCSISTVSTSTRPRVTNSSMASASVNAPTTCRAATAAGAGSVGSSTLIGTPRLPCNTHSKIVAGFRHGACALFRAVCESVLLPCPKSVLLPCSNSPSWPSRLRCRVSAAAHTAR